MGLKQTLSTMFAPPFGAVPGGHTVWHAFTYVNILLLLLFFFHDEQTRTPMFFNLIFFYVHVEKGNGKYTVTDYLVLINSTPWGEELRYDVTSRFILEANSLETVARLLALRANQTTIRRRPRCQGKETLTCIRYFYIFILKRTVMLCTPKILIMT